MNRLPAALTATALAFWASSLPAQSVPAGQSFGEQVDVNIVNVEVYVTDKDGRPVTGLERGDFKLFEDGKPMTVVNFEGVDRKAEAAPAQTGAAGAAAVEAADPMHLVVFVDNTHIASFHRARVLQQLRDRLARDLAPGDRVMLATYDPGLHVRLPFTADRGALAAALDALDAVPAKGSNKSLDRRFVWQQVLSIQQQARIEGEIAAKHGGGVPLRKLEDQKDAQDTSDEAESNENGDEFATRCPRAIADPVKAYAQDERQKILRSINGLTVLVSSLSALPGRKALLHISDGIDVTPGEDLFQALNTMCAGAELLSVTTYNGMQAPLDAQSFNTAQQWNELAAHASAQRVTLYTLQASGLESAAAAAADLGQDERLLQSSQVDRIERENRRGSLVALASGSGGRAILDANDIASDIDRLGDDLDHYYSLGYAPPHQGDGRNHKIEVKVQRPGVRVRHRQLYRDKPSLERVVDRTLAALFLGNGDNPLGVTLQIGDMVPQSTGALVPLRLLIPLNNVGLTLRGTTYEGKLRVLVTTLDAEGGNAPVRQVEVPLHIPTQNSQATMMQSYLYEVKLQLPPGEHRVALAVRDDVTTLASYLAQKVQVGSAPAK